MVLQFVNSFYAAVSCMNKRNADPAASNRLVRDDTLQKMRERFEEARHLHEIIRSKSHDFWNRIKSVEHKRSCRIFVRRCLEQSCVNSVAAIILYDQVLREWRQCSVRSSLYETIQSSLLTSRPSLYAFTRNTILVIFNWKIIILRNN